jgi:hypothetical protein
MEKHGLNGEPWDIAKPLNTIGTLVTRVKMDDTFKKTTKRESDE